LASIQPITLVLFIACISCVLSLWSRRSGPGAMTVVALTAALWGGLWMRAVTGDTTIGVGLSCALLLFAPAYILKGVQDHLITPSSSGRGLRRGLFFGTCAFAGLAATSAYHSLFVSVSAGEISYLPGGYLAGAFALAVFAIAIHAVLTQPNGASSSMLRYVVFLAAPLAVAALGFSGFYLGHKLGGINPAAYGLAVTCAIGPWLLVRSEYSKDDGVRNLLFARLPDPVVALDGEQRIVDCNEAFADLVDYPLAELPGNLLQELISEDNYAAVAEPEGQEFEVRWDRGDSVVEHYAVAVLAPESGGATQVLHFTERDSERHAQQALETADLQLEQANASLDRLKFNDELTGLANQRRFVDELEREIARHQRSGLRFGVISIEADHFNLLAEQHGSAFRDRSLALIARAIEVELRDTDLCARLEGEEFAVLAVQMKIPGLVELAERIRKRVLKVRPHAPGGERVRMSVSLGVSLFDPKQDDLRGLLARTSRYLAEAKRSGRNQVVSGD